MNLHKAKNHSPLANRRRFIIVLTLAFFLRATIALWLGDVMEVIPVGGTHDQITYDMLGKRVAEGKGLTFPEPWYPWIQADTPSSYFSGPLAISLGIIYKVFGYHPLIARLVFSLLGTFAVYLIHRLGRRLFGKTAGLLSAGFAACYAYLILYSATLLTETPFIVFLLLALEGGYMVVEDERDEAFWLVGIGLAGALLFRSAVLVFIPVFLVWLYLASPGAARLQTKVVKYLVPAGIIFVAVLPWTVRNYRLYGRFMLLQSQFGHVFWNANHPAQGTDFRGPWVAPIPKELLNNLNEADLTYELLRQGRQFITEDPGRFLLLSVDRFVYLFTFWPTADSSFMSNIARLLSFGIMVPFMLAGLALSLRQWRRLVPIYLFIILHIGIYVSSWVMIRYRVPVDAVLLLFAGLSVATLMSLVRKYWQRWHLEKERVEEPAY